MIEDSKEHVSQLRAMRSKVDQAMALHQTIVGARGKEKLKASVVAKAFNASTEVLTGTVKDKEAVIKL